MTIAMTTPSAGWYQDPGDGQTLRWWDGMSWTAHTRTQVQELPAVPATPYAPFASSAAATGYTPFASTIGEAAPYGSQFTMREIGSPQNAGIWLLAVSPVLFPIIGFVTGFTLGFFGLVTDETLRYANFAGGALGLILYWTFAGLDIHSLRKNGYEPPSIFWMLLVPPLAYFIARGRRVRRDGGKAWPAELTFFLCVVGIVVVAFLAVQLVMAYGVSMGLIVP